MRRESGGGSASCWTTAMVSLPWKGHMPACAIIHCAWKQYPLHHHHTHPHTYTMVSHTTKIGSGQLVTTAKELRDGLSMALMQGIKFIISLILFVKWNTSQRVTKITKPSIKISLAHPWDYARSTRSVDRRLHHRHGDHVSFAFSPLFFRLLQRVSSGLEDE